MDTLLGQILGGRYKIINSLGGGAFGQTYIAEDLQLPDHPRCVVKQLKPQTKDEQTLKIARRLFDTEATVLHRLGSHDQIPRLLAHFEEKQEFYLVQDCIEGQPLSQEIQPGKQLSEAKVIALLNDVLSVLAFVHGQNVIHRDLKPSNLIRRASDGKLVLIDFGAVKQVSSQGISEGATVAIGTPGYMPSEQLAGSPRPNSDIYALGAIAIQALTGTVPSRFPQDPVSGELVWRDKAQVSEPLAQILDKMVRSHFRDRYPSAEEVLADLANLKNCLEAPTQNQGQPTPSQIRPPNRSTSTGGAPDTPTGTVAPPPVPPSPVPPPPVPRRFKPWYLWVLGAVLGVSACSLAFFLRPDPLSQADKLIDAQQPEAALTIADQVLKNKPDNAKAWKIQGDAYFLLERYEQALIAYDKALKIQPNDPKIWNNRGKTLYQLQRYDEALKSHDKALEINPSDAQALNGRGLALIGMKRFQEALDAFDKARQIQPKDPKSWENQALALEYLQRSQDARQAYQEALASYNDTLQANPKDIQALVDRGNVLSKLQRFPEALKSFEDAIVIDPNYYPAWVGQGSALFFLQRSDDALKAYGKALEIRPKFHIAWHNRASLLAELGRLDDAIKDYDKVLEFNPDFYQAWRDRGFALLQLKRQQEALVSFDKALRTEPNDPKSWVGRGIALTVSNRYDEALAALDKALKIDPGDLVALLNRGFALEGLGRNDEALEVYNKAIEIQPNFQAAIQQRKQLQQKLYR
jgi:tetratricopeptide (TPR) repeat protein/tRNA A-37 threonylcarbamoyl transferase component Bud32